VLAGVVGVVVAGVVRPAGPWATVLPSAACAPGGGGGDGCDGAGAADGRDGSPGDSGAGSLSPEEDSSLTEATVALTAIGACASPPLEYALGGGEPAERA